VQNSGITSTTKSVEFTELLDTINALQGQHGAPECTEQNLAVPYFADADTIRIGYKTYGLTAASEATMRRFPTLSREFPTIKLQLEKVTINAMALTFSKRRARRFDQHMEHNGDQYPGPKLHGVRTPCKPAEREATPS
jgi:hypothetical protein